MGYSKDANPSKGGSLFFPTYLSIMTPKFCNLPISDKFCAIKIMCKFEKLLKFCFNPFYFLSGNVGTHGMGLVSFMLQL